MSPLDSKNSSLSTFEAAKQSGYTSAHLSYLARSGKIPAERDGSGWLIKKDDLAAYVTRAKEEADLQRLALANKRKEEYHERQAFSHPSPLTRKSSKAAFVPLMAIVPFSFGEVQNMMGGAMSYALKGLLLLLAGFGTVGIMQYEVPSRVAERAPTPSSQAAPFVTSTTTTTTTTQDGGAIATNESSGPRTIEVRTIVERIITGGISDAYLQRELMQWRNDLYDDILARERRQADSDAEREADRDDDDDDNDSGFDGDFDGLTITNSTFEGTAVDTDTLLAGNATTTSLYTNGFGLGGDYISDMTGFGLAVVNGELTVTLAGSAFATSSADFWFSTKDTDDLAEGTTNLYYADGRVQTYLDTVDKGYFFSTTSAAAYLAANPPAGGSGFSTTSANFWLGTKSTSDIAEGTNQYFTLNRFASALAGTTTDALLEGSSNLYFSNARARAALSGGAGIAYSTSTGTISLNASGDWTGTFDGQEGAYYLNRTNQTGSQLASTISDFATTARGLFSSTAPGVTYNAGTGVFSLTAGYTIPLTASTTEWATAYGWGNHATQNYFDKDVDDTGDLAEGSNLFFTNVRVQTYLNGVDKGFFFSTTSAQFFLAQNQGASFSTTSANAWLTTKSTTNLAEGTNLYYTLSRFASALAGTTTDALTEGLANRYFTDARARSALSGGSGITYSTTTGAISLDRTGDWTGTFDGQEGSYYLNRANQTGTQLANTISNFTATVASIIAGTTTDALNEGTTNQYFTTARVQTFLNTISKGYFFSTTSADFYLAQNQGAAFSTTSANAFLNSFDKGYFFSTTSANAYLATKTTDNLTEGVSNLYFSNARARNAVSAGPGLSYSTTTGVFALDAGGNWTGTFDGQEGSYYLNRANHTGTQLANTISDFNVAADARIAAASTTIRGMFSSTATGLTYTSGTGVFSLTSGYTIPLSASTTAWNAFYDTPSSRITAGTNLSWTGNTLNGLSNSAIRGLFSAVSPISYDNTTGVFTFSTAGDWTGTFDGQEGAYYLANSFSTTSASFFLAQNQGAAFSTTSANAWLATKSTTNLSEGTNLYYTDARVNAYIAASSSIPKTYATNSFSGTNTFTQAGLTVSGVVDGCVEFSGGKFTSTGSNCGTGSGGITSLNGLTASGQTFATSSDTNIGISIVSSGATHTFTPTWSGTLAASRGGTGLSTVIPNQLLIGGAGNTWTQTATSSLGLPTFTDLGAYLSLAAWYATTTDALEEGVSNLYYTDARVQTFLDTIAKGYFFSTTSANAFLATKTTDDLAEGTTNLYFSNSRARSALSGGAGITYSTTTGIIALNNTGDWTGTLDGQEGTYYLNRANHTGTQLANTISDFNVAADARIAAASTTIRGMFSSTATGLTYTSATGVFSLTGGYSIPLTASTTDWQTAYANRITSATAPLSILNNVISISQAGTATDGFLSAADWNSFNSRLSTTTLGLFDKGYFFSTTSAQFFLAQNQGAAFSTTSANAWLATKSTTDLAEGTNQYYTLARFAAALAGTTTDALNEGVSNLYFSNSRARSALSGGAGIIYSTTTGVIALNNTGDWTGTFDGQEGSYYLNRANHTGTQLANTISDFNLAADARIAAASTTIRGMFSSTATGLTYTAATGVFSLTGGYTIPLTASTSAWNTFYETPSTRITAGTNLSWTGNTLNGPSDGYIRGLFSATSPISYDNATGVFSFSTAGDWTGTFDGQEGSYYLANSFSTTSAQFFLAQNQGAAFSTTSANAWLATKTTDNLTEGITNLYFSNARARSALSAGAGITYSTTTGIIALNNTGDWTGTLDGQEGTYYLNRANHTGTQLANTISDFNVAADARIAAASTTIRGMFSST
ncbi:MAG: hypothetical protein V4644_03215, partial [Patescibacteria group bacterium]